MCHDCFLDELYQFESASAYEAFETQLRQKLASSLLQAEQNAPIDFTTSPYRPEAYYRCASCHESWALSSPDNAWRGYFLPLDAAIAYSHTLRRKDRFKAVVGSVCLLAFGVSIVWAILQ